MEQVENMIQIYHTCFIVFLILALVFLAATITMFIVFKIPKVFELRTGKGAQKTVQKMKGKNAVTGSSRLKKMTRTERLPVTREDVITRPKTEELSAEDLYVSEKTTVLQQENEADRTTILEDNLEDGRTTLLEQNEEDQQTTVLMQQEMAQDDIWQRTVGKFVLGEKIMLVHTDIVI